MNIIKVLKHPFQRNHTRYEGVPNINIYLLRLLFFLTFAFVGYSSWSSILTHHGPWDHVKAVAFCVWASYSTLSILGLIHPLKMLPIVMFQILYKSIWLLLIAYPLWSTNQLKGSPAEEMTYTFLWIPLAIFAMPWGYAFRNYVLGASRFRNTNDR